MVDYPNDRDRYLHPDRAVQAWQSALRARPDDSDLLVSLAVAEAADGRTERAMQTLRRATDSDPGSSRAWAQLGVLALSHQDLGTAGNALLRALDLEPTNAEARFHLAVLHLRVGAVEEAVAALRDLAQQPGAFAHGARTLLDQIDG